MKSCYALIFSISLQSSFSFAVDISDKVSSMSENSNKIEIKLDKSVVACTQTIDSVLKALNSANKVIVSAPKFSDCNGQESSAVITFF